MRKIGIVGWNLGDNSFGATKTYLEYLSRYSNNIVIIGPNTLDTTLDLLVLPGGKDVTNGNDKISFTNSLADPFLEHFDNNLLPQYIENRVPIFGICRGAQALFKHTGVPLVQNIDWNHGYSKDENDTKVNKLLFTADYWDLAKISDNTVGSWHHQCALYNEHHALNNWNVVAYTKDKKVVAIFHDNGVQYVQSEPHVIEYAKHKDYNIWAVQSHPERNDNPLDTYIIQQMLNNR